jgi:hypothetical protein
VGTERSEEIVDYYCGCPPRPALIFNLIEGFEMACKVENAGGMTPGYVQKPDNAFAFSLEEAPPCGQDSSLDLNFLT